MFKVVFSASGADTQVYRFHTLAAAYSFMKKDATSTALDYDGTYQLYDREAIVNEKNGNEICRWEIKEYKR